MMFYTRQKLTENNLESLSELIEIREDAFKRVDSELLTQRLRFNWGIKIS